MDDDTKRHHNPSFTAEAIAEEDAELGCPAATASSADNDDPEIPGSRASSFADATSKRGSIFAERKNRTRKNGKLLVCLSSAALLVATAALVGVVSLMQKQHQHQQPSGLTQPLAVESALQLEAPSSDLLPEIAALKAKGNPPVLPRAEVLHESFSTGSSLTPTREIQLGDLVDYEVQHRIEEGYRTEIEQAVATMAGSPEDLDVQDYGISTLASLPDGMSDEIGSAGGIELVTAAMARFPNDFMIQYNGCRVLNDLWRSAGNREAIRGAGGTQLVVAAVERFPTDYLPPILVEEVRDTTAEETRHDSEPLNGLQIPAGIIAGLQDPTSEEFCYEYHHNEYDPCTRADVLKDLQWFLAQYYLDVDPTAINLDGIDLEGANFRPIPQCSGRHRWPTCTAEEVLSVMEASPDDLALQDDACDALGDIAEDPSAQTAIVEAGGVELVLAAMSAFPDDEFGDNAHLQGSGAYALWSLARNSSSNRAAIGAAGGIEALVGAIQTFEGTSFPAGEEWIGCRALDVLAEDSPSNVEAIVSAGGREALNAVMTSGYCSDHMYPGTSGPRVGMSCMTVCQAASERLGAVASAPYYR
eukprot:COSAG06_NODE_974_length_11258_cov_31.877319_11_plen_587_part_00